MGLANIKSWFISTSPNYLMPLISIATKKELHMKFLQTVAAGLAVKVLWVLFTNINWILLVPIVTDESVVQFMMV